MTILPDPTADLHWSAYRGAIQDIFAANAAKYPDRVCIVETASSTTPRREFSYRQINEASNVLAHYLIESGIERGDVITVYAYRGVDLVVACYGILKAGATWSVIDPQYPADRQVIYLDVAQPKALIVIKKASDDSGPLSKQVRDFVDKSLKLKTEVPALEFQDDGTLKGGVVDPAKGDCFTPLASRKGEQASVLVGPDSTPTLSFTSGSEGRPKGVRGRHFSLAYYFDWMSQKFKLTEKDKFTMLSGIAHDPIQRDMFTPLFLGAQLVVPPAEDITFERLAPWAAKNEVTVCHLTPAMGQILLGNPSGQKVNSLHHVFFVGDLLLKRDCRKLQDLAPNVNIVNMFGTTETQRAVSYHEIPSKIEDPDYLNKMGDVIPAGKGMYDVQLIVVDRENPHRVCDIGEIGEIYVRGGGLAEGYLGADYTDLNKQKFVTNWFVDPKRWIEEDEKRVAAQEKPEPWRQFYYGPRDRLYRSGDLGRYIQTGDVECTGRADDQVKIRGFRIELGEIDTYLAEHDLISQNCTIVKKDHNQDSILVSYVVPDMERWQQWAQGKDKEGLSEAPEDTTMATMLRRFRALSSDVREALKRKLPYYAIPTIFVPMVRLPLTPNGKVDKRALPFPTETEMLAAGPRTSEDVSKRTETEKGLAEIWAKYMPGISSATLPSDVPFFDLGGNSISAQQMLSDVSRRWDGARIPLSAIYKSSTLKAFASEIDRALDPAGLRLEAQVNGVHSQEEHYASTLPDIIKQLPQKLPTAKLDPSQPQTVFLTGATGFLGSYIIRDILSRPTSHTLIAHVRAASPESGLARIKKTCIAYGVWEESWATRIRCVTGDLAAQPTLGVLGETWKSLADEVDVIVHNGAIVHWVLPFSNMKAANVLSTLSLIDLCNTGKPKRLVFISSTSVLDSEHYVALSEKNTAAGLPGVTEDDDLDGSKQDLPNGYGQTKWVSEQLVREAGRRGLRGAVVRPGYILGDPSVGTTITDDFLIRFLKGSLQLNSRPNITNKINASPVSHVARLIGASALDPRTDTPFEVRQVTGHPRLTFNEYLAALETFGYDVPVVEYDTWRKKAETYVSDDSKEQFALLGLYSMVTTTLPSGTKAPELSDTNSLAVLAADQGSPYDKKLSAITEDTVGVYLAYLVAVGFMPAPTKQGVKKLPVWNFREGQEGALKGLGGRGGIA